MGKVYRILRNKRMVWEMNEKIKQKVIVLGAILIIILIGLNIQSVYAVKQLKNDQRKLSNNYITQHTRWLSMALEKQEDDPSYTNAHLYEILKDNPDALAKFIQKLDKVILYHDISGDPIRQRDHLVTNAIYQDHKFSLELYHASLINHIDGKISTYHLQMVLDDLETIHTWLESRKDNQNKYYSDTVFEEEMKGKLKVHVFF